MSTSFKIEMESRVIKPIHLAERITKLLLCGSDFFLYEKGEKCFLGLGVNAKISADTSGTVIYSSSIDEQKFSGKRISLLIQEAIEYMNVDDWRLHGLVYFDLSILIHQLDVNYSNHQPAFEFILPKIDIEISKTLITIKIADENEFDSSQIKEKIQALLNDVTFTELDKYQPQKDTREIDITSDTNYQKHVKDAVECISNNDFLKVILSRRVYIPFKVDLLESFGRARKNNTPARSFIYQLDNRAAFGLSPETVVEVSSEGVVSTQPLAGTRSLGESPEEEARLKAELLSDSKEIAEHAISVKLAVEEMESICNQSSVAVSEFMNVKRRGSVQHIASRVVGQLQEERCSWDALIALFPAITASGISKKKSIQYIYDMEPYNRGLYSGASILADSTGMLDAALVIRTLFKEGDDYWLQAGAGIVKESRFEREFEETCEKLSAISKFVIEAA